MAASPESGPETTLWTACLCGMRTEVRQLLADGANTEEQSQGFHPSTPLQISCQSGNTDIVKTLLEYGADVSVIDDSDGATTLHLAVTVSFSNDDGELVERGHQAAAMLIKKGVDVASKDFSGWTALHRAAYYGHIQITRVLLDHGANVLCETQTGETAE